MSSSEPEEVVGSETEPGDGQTGDVEAGAVAEVSDDEVDENLEIEVEAEEVSDEPPDPIAELKAQVETLDAAKRDNYDRFVRASADLENFRKRARRDVTDARIDERGKILKDMLPVIDNLERAVMHAQSTEAEATKGIVEGVNLVLRQFQQALERHNVKGLDAVGKAFDPAVHEAVSQVPSADHPPGTVIAVLQTGYMIEERLLRPALAVVSCAMPAEAAEGGDAAESEVAESDAPAAPEEEPVSDTDSSEDKE